MASSNPPEPLPKEKTDARRSPRFRPHQRLQVGAAFRQRACPRSARARWALEEAGVPYAVRKLDAAVERPADYFEEQPFGQVPSYRDDTVSLFESGAIVLHVGRNCEALVPTDPAAQARATRG